MMGRIKGVAAAVAAAMVLSGCSLLDVTILAGDRTEGRDNDTTGSAEARRYILEELRPITYGAVSGTTGDEAYLQSFPGGTNVLAIIPGTDLADEYVIVGAHYDHLGRRCRTTDPTDDICNGATDNAAGVAAVLGIARELTAHGAHPRRSVVLALWDREEDGLLGSRFYTEHPVVPLADTVGYVNFDIQGANLLPSLRTTTFAIGTESGSGLAGVVRTAASTQDLRTTLLSSVFGQYRSDYVNFLNVGVPSVFFTDATGGCYHTTDDEVAVVDFAKLDQQITTALKVVRALARADHPPAFVAGAPLATFDDLVRFKAVIDRGSADLALFAPADRDRFRQIRDDAARLVADGRAAFGDDDVGTLLGDAAAAVDILTRLACDGFLAPS